MFVLKKWKNEVALDWDVEIVGVGLEENISRAILFMLVLETKKPIHTSTLIHLSFLPVKQEMT